MRAHGYRVNVAFLRDALRRAGLPRSDTEPRPRASRHRGRRRGALAQSHPGGAGIAATVMEKDAGMGRDAVFHDNRVEVERALMTRAEFLRASTALGRAPS